MSMPSSRLIDDEALALSKLSDDVDNYRRTYSLSDEDILIQFVAPKIIAFDKYKYYLLQNSNSVQLVPSRYYRPDYVAYDYYGTPNLWPLILFINDISCMEDFDIETVLIPTKKAVSAISMDLISQSTLQKLETASNIVPSPTAPLFSGLNPIPLNTSQEIVPPFFPVDMYFFRESFTVDVVMARAKSVDLSFVPVIESVVLKIKDNPNYLYNKHYIITKGSIGNNRLTWDAKLISNGIGLTSVLVEGTLFEVSYARKV